MAYEDTKIYKDYQVSNWDVTIPFNVYKEKILEIKKAICEGETYQVNYTFPLRTVIKGDSYSYFNFLDSKQLGDYSAFLDIGDYKILSISPELFFEWSNQKITTKPMKGTVKRGKTLNEDMWNFNWLKNSLKNQAENLMIVDLIRNDLGKIALPGTVKVPKLFEIEEYPTVFQLTSTITAETRPEIELIDIFESLFPSGSITGAPKVSTINKIDELETDPREVYCGTVGIITPNNEAVFNVAIRTLIIDSNSNIAEYSVGGGITWDSDPYEEYSEAMSKAKVLFGK